MNLTFLGFLRGYCRELTGLQTDSLKKLCGSVVSEQPAAAEAVMTFAAAKGKQRYLLALSKGTQVENNYAAACKAIECYENVEVWLQSESAPDRYKKVWLAYQAKRNAPENDRRVIMIMRGKTLDAMKAAGLTSYRLCKDLGLNLGNVYAYLSKGDASKVSRATARKIMEHASRTAENQISRKTLTTAP